MHTKVLKIDTRSQLFFLIHMPASVFPHTLPRMHMTKSPARTDVGSLLWHLHFTPLFFFFLHAECKDKPKESCVVVSREKSRSEIRKWVFCFVLFCLFFLLCLFCSGLGDSSYLCCSLWELACVFGMYAASCTIGWSKLVS